MTLRYGVNLLLLLFFYGAAGTTLFSVKPSNYDGMLPPPKMANPDPLNVSFGMSIKSLDLDIMHSHLHVEFWFRLAWLDSRLDYDGEAAFGNNFDNKTKSVPINIMDGDNPNLWVPDIVCYNATDAEMQSFSTMNAYIYPRQFTKLDPFPGADSPYNVLLVRPGKMTAYCKPSLENFPYDEQICNLHFGSWAFNGDFIDMHLLENGFEKTVDSPDSNEYEWTELSSAIWNRKYESTGDTVWSEVVLTITLRRYPRYFALNAVLPMFMMVIISNLTFWIPINPNYTGNGERMSFAITCMLTIVAIGLFTADKRPMIGVTTWLDRWISSCLLFTSLPIVETIGLFYLQGIFHSVQDREDETEKKHQGYKFNKYQQLSRKAESFEAHQSKNIMKSMLFVIKKCDCFTVFVSPTALDAISRHLFPVISLGRLLLLLGEVRDDWKHWTFANSGPFFTLFVPFVLLTIWLCFGSVWWTACFFFQVYKNKGKKPRPDMYSDSDQSTDSDASAQPRGWRRFG